jgi:hypothetical protein
VWVSFWSNTLSIYAKSLVELILMLEAKVFLTKLAIRSALLDSLSMRITSLLPHWEANGCDLLLKVPELS